MFKYAKTDFQAILRIIFFAVVLSGIASAVLYFTPLPETFMGLISSLILAVSVLLGGVYASSRIRRRGLIQGLRVGLFFFLLMTIATYLFHRSPLTFSDLYPTFLLVIASGGIGGIVGVDKKKKKQASRSLTHQG